MNRLKMLLVLFVSISIVACDNNTNKTTTPSNVQDPNAEVIERYNNVSKEEADQIIADRAREKAEERAANLPGFREHAKELVKQRAQIEKAPSILVVDHWVYEFVFSGREMSKPGEYDGQWIKFEDDHSYTYGHYNKVNGSGQFHYSLETGKLVMVDDKDDMMPEEWTIKAQDEVMILEGSSYFGNNPRQCKMLRWNGRPVPPAG